MKTYSVILAKSGGVPEVGVISVRLNKDEDKMLRELSEHFHADKSTLIKKSLFELYESVADMEAVEAFERKEKRGKVSFTSADDVLKG